MTDNLNQRALDYHAANPPGKLEISATKPMTTQDDLSLAYSPGVAAPCLAIADDPALASSYTARANLVAVISNGTAVLGLGKIGALASKPVMEGKAVLFKRFSGINVFDIEIEERDVDAFCEAVARLEATFGGINLEDIAAPECFEIERRLRERMNIPVFHDDQHGTAIVTAAAIVSGLKVADKQLADCRVVASGAGAAALACLDLLVSMGLPREQVLVVDRKGVVYQGRSEQMDEHKERYAADTDKRSLDDAIENADIFLGLSGPGVLTQDHCRKMAPSPLILALANPDPEIRPEDAREARPDALICTGRSDYPNQVNNVLCFPFIFRGALDVGATDINEDMKIACVEALSALAEAEPSDIVQNAYAGEALTFGPEYLLPKPFDPRLIIEVASAVAAAAMASGVATRQIEDMDAYRRSLAGYVYKSTSVMTPIFERARSKIQRLVYAEGEDDRVLEAVQQVVDGGLAKPILVGREEVIAEKIDALSLRLEIGSNIEVATPYNDSRLAAYANHYYARMGRRGVSRVRAEYVVRSRNTVFAACMLDTLDADGMICGTNGPFAHHLQLVRDVIGKREGVLDLSTLIALVLPNRVLFVCDTHVTPYPSSLELAEMTLLAADEVSRFGIEPAVALLSYSNFGTADDDDARRIREAVSLLRERAPELNVDGEMHGDAALSEIHRARSFDQSTLQGEANLLIMPSREAAHIAYSLLKIVTDGVFVGPMLLGAAKPVNIVTQSISVRGLVNMSAYTATRAQEVL